MQYELVNIAQLRIFFKYIKKIFTQKAFKLSKYTMQFYNIAPNDLTCPKNHYRKNTLDCRTVREKYGPA